MTKSIKPWVIDTMANNVEAGISTIEKISDPKLAAKVSAILKQRQAARAQKIAGNDMIHMTGRVIRETDTAVLFRETPIYGQGENTEESWWPKAMVKIVYRETGHIDGLHAPSKLVAEKTKCHPIFVAGEKA